VHESAALCRATGERLRSPSSQKDEVEGPREEAAVGRRLAWTAVGVEKEIRDSILSKEGSRDRMLCGWYNRGGKRWE